MESSTSIPQKLPNYPPLQNPTLESRLLTLLPDPDFFAPIHIELHAVNLSDVEGQYTALSYAWGDPSNTAPITLNGHMHHVTTNLQAALRHLRLDSETTTLWVDAICINQDDDAEKSSQVQQMGRIYRSAELVIAWLGEASDDSDFLLDLVLATAERDNPKGPDQSLPRRQGEEYPPSVEKSDKYTAASVSFESAAEIDNLLSAPQPHPTHENQRLVNAMTKFVHRDWWSRLWVVQEILLARQVLYQCGGKKVLHDHIIHLYEILPFAISQGVTALDTSGSYKQLETISMLLAHRRLVRDQSLPKCSESNSTRGHSDAGGHSNNSHPKNEMESQDAEDDGSSGQEIDANNSLHSLLSSFSRRQTTKPVDKIYALLGLADDRDKFEPPDYSKSYLSVFSKVARAIIEHEGNLDVLRMAGIGDSPTGDTYRLPSWAPDWTTRRYYAVVYGMEEWRACGDTGYQPEYRFLPGSPGILAATGVLVDIVSATSSVLDEIDERRLLTRERLLRYGTARPYFNRQETLMQAYFYALLCKPLTLEQEEFEQLKAAFLYNMGEGIDRDSDEETPGLEPADYVASVLRWAGEDCRSRSDQLIVDQFMGSELRITSSADSLHLGAKLHNDYRFKRYVIDSKCGGHIIETKKGYIGMASDRVRNGDAVCVLFGCLVPLIMRRDGDCWTLVQSSYVHGLMEGEAMEQLREGKLRKQEFKIR